MAIASNVLISPTSANAVATAPTATSGTAAIAGATDAKTIAGNFTTFLQLLTTQLRNQNPLDPLDTNQFTQQLVQFAQVEQQMKQNDQLATMISLEQATQATSALAFVGATVAVDGQTAALTHGKATWNLLSPKVANATITIRNAAGQTVYTATQGVNPGAQPFNWDGRDNSGNKLPDGNYTMAVVGKDTSGQSAAIPTEIEGVVDAFDLSQAPPVLSIGGQNFTIGKIKRVVASKVSDSATPLDGVNSALSALGLK